MRGAGVLLTLALALGACDRGDDPDPTPLPPTPAPVADAASPQPEPASPQTVGAVPAARLSPAGYGPLGIGMTTDEAARALGAPLDFGPAAAAQPEQCRYGRSPKLPGVLIMMEQGRVARIDLAEGSKIKTDKGLGLGDTREAVRAAYGVALHEDGHKYLPAPAAYLESWNADRSRGVRYEIDEGGRVEDVYAGGPAVNYVEGCS